MYVTFKRVFVENWIKWNENWILICYQYNILLRIILKYVHSNIIMINYLIYKQHNMCLCQSHSNYLFIWRGKSCSCFNDPTYFIFIPILKKAMKKGFNFEFGILVRLKARKRLLTGTVPVNNLLLTGTVLVNKGVQGGGHVCNIPCILDPN